jgi:hypothetical protein
MGFCGLFPERIFLIQSIILLMLQQLPAVLGAIVLSGGIVQSQDTDIRPATHSLWNHPDAYAAIEPGSQ